MLDSTPSGCGTNDGDDQRIRQGVLWAGRPFSTTGAERNARSTRRRHPPIASMAAPAGALRHLSHQNTPATRSQGLVERLWRSLGARCPLRHIAGAEARGHGGGNRSGLHGSDWMSGRVQARQVQAGIREFRDGPCRQLQGNNATGSADAIIGMAGQGVVVISWSAAARAIAFKAQHEFDRCRRHGRRSSRCRWRGQAGCRCQFYSEATNDKYFVGRNVGKNREKVIFDALSGSY